MLQDVGRHLDLLRRGEVDILLRGPPSAESKNLRDEVRAWGADGQAVLQPLPLWLS